MPFKFSLYGTPVVVSGRTFETRRRSTSRYTSRTD